jgi:hypothetical protein
MIQHFFPVVEPCLYIARTVYSQSQFFYLSLALECFGVCIFIIREVFGPRRIIIELYIVRSKYILLGYKPPGPV